MREYTLIVYSNHTPGNEEAFNEWYTREHLPDVLALPGFVSARRFRVMDFKLDENGPDPTHRYVAMYNLYTDDPEAALNDLRSRVESGRIVISQTMVPDFQAVACEAITPLVEAQE